MSPSKRRKLTDRDIEDILGDDSEEYDSDSDIESSDSQDSTASSDSDDSVAAALPSDWCSTGVPRAPFTFTATPGPQFNVDDPNDTVSYFENYFDNDICEHIVTETNRFADQFIAQNLGAKRISKWDGTSIAELKVFLALLILQGVDSKSTNRMYFSTRECVANQFFKKTMSGRRFELLHKFLHFVDNDSIDNTAPTRKLAKISLLIDMVLAKFQSNYIPEKNISIDESLLGWKGNLGWVQYIPTKRKRFGMKFYELCESESGYIWNFFVYTGTGTQYNEKYEDLPVTSKIVMTLLDPLLDKGYCLYIDNYYSSPSLSDLLCTKLTDCVGTVRMNRKEMPKNVKDAKLKKGEIACAFRRKTMALKWKDKRDVGILSSIHDNAMVQVKSRRGRAGIKPQAIADYNANMGGVDLSDNLLTHFSCARNRLKKFYKKIFLHLLDMAILNAFLMYKKNGGNLTRADYIMDVSERLVTKYKPLIPIPSTSGSGGRGYTILEKPSRLIGRHFPEYCPQAGNRKAMRRCALCSKNGKRKSSSFWCPDCDVGLCVAPCFKLWHTQN